MRIVFIGDWGLGPIPNPHFSNVNLLKIITKYYKNII